MERNLVLSDFANTPGEMNNGMWFFPKVETTCNRTGKARVWSIFVIARIGEQQINIINDWILGNSDPPAGTNAYYFTMSGQVGGKITKSAEKIVSAGKVKRNIIQQALSEAMKEWRKQVAKTSGELIKPQLLTDLDEDSYKSVIKKFGQNIQFYVSYKYNGVRCMATMKDGRPMIYSRTCKEYDLPHLTEALGPIFEEHPDIIIDGEVYFHGMPQSDISGLVRSGEETKLTETEKLARNNLIYHIFDIIDPANLAIPFAERYKKLINIIKPSRFYLPVECFVVPNNPNLLATATAMMIQANNIGLEGIVLRISSAGYDESVNGYHSINVLKKKPVLSFEFMIIGYEDGKGKNENTLQWICEVPENLRQKGGTPGKQFHVVPKGTYEDKQALFARLENEPELFVREFRGKMITIEFMEWSNYGVPVQIRAMAIRSPADL